MAPATVRTIPPWVIQRPPQSLLPQHNHAPADPRHGRGAPDSHRDGVDYVDNSHSDANGHAPNGTGTGDAAVSVDGAAAVVPAAGMAEGPDISIGDRISHMFRRKEGRKWDHLRSAEPVIVPQFHVVNGPLTFSRGDEYSGKRRRSLQSKGRDDEDGEAGPGGDGAGPADAASAAAAAATDTFPGSPAPAFRRGDGSSGEHPSAGGAYARQPWWHNPETPWRGFIESSRYPHIPHEKSEIVNDEEMARLYPRFGYNTVLPPRAGGGDGGGGGGGVGHFHHRPKYLSDKAFYQRVWQTLLHHPLGPLACRLTVLTTSIVALVIAATIFRRERLGSLARLSHGGGGAADDYDSVWLADQKQERAQIVVAIVVDVVAIPYIGYITVDDYTGKPLGLRPPQARIRLILTDMFFIIFKSASTALGFEAMIFFDTESRQGLLRALGAFELIGLISWALTLTINIFREIERLGGGK